MKIDIAYYIRQVLREQRNVYVPEIGTFSLRQSPASFSDDMKSIHPPSLSIDFEEGNSEDSSLFQYIKDTELFSDKKIESSISDFAQYIFNKLINVNQYELKDIGTLSRLEGENSVFFSSNVESLTKEFNGLTSIGIKPISRIAESEEIAHTVNVDQVPVRTDESSPWWYPVLAGLIIAGIFILCMKGCQENWFGSSDTTQEQELYIEDDANETEPVDSSLIKELDAKYEEVDKLVDESGLGGGKVREELSNLTPNVVSDNSTDTETVSSGAKSIENGSNGNIEGNNESNDSSESESSIIIPNSGKCVIILGSFKKARNISKMISLIEREGKTVYTSQYNGKTRVGFSFDCENVELDKYLYDIRNRLSTKAWYLDPNLAVPYK